MNAATRGGDAPDVQILASWRLMPGALLILGRSSGALPKSGSARAGTSPGALGVFRLDFWSYEPGHAFVAAVRLPPRAEPTDHAELILRGARASDRDVSIRLPAPSSEAEFGRQLSVLAQRHAAPTARFLFELLRPEDADATGSSSSLLEHFLSQAAKPDGCVELVLAQGPHCVVLQGWGSPLAEPVEIIATRPFPARLAVQVGRFARDDVDPPSTGCVLVLPTEAPAAAYLGGTIFLLANNALLSRTVIDNTVREGDEATGQLRHLLTRLDCAPSLVSTLKAALLPRFEGRDTLNQTSRRVRAAVDQAVGCEHAGLYLSGWLFDPEKSVTSVELCTSEVVTRLDQRFVRIERPDVGQAFQRDPSVHDGCKSQSWGFAVDAQVPWGGAPTYLRFTFADDDVAFLPLRIASAKEAATRRALRESVDLHKPSGLTVVEQCLAPFFSRLPPLPTSHSMFWPGPLERPHAIVVPLSSALPPRAVIASLLEDPVEPNEQLVLVCGDSWGRGSLLRLKELFQFYGLPISILVVAGNIDPTSALHAAMAETMATDFLLLSAESGVFEIGWRKDLRHRAADYDVVCPTVLHEDYAIRFQGGSAFETFEHPPYARTRAARSGRPAALDRPRGPLATQGGSVGCALLNRRAVAALPPSSPFASPTMQEAAMFRTIAFARLRLGWIPGLTVVAPYSGDAEQTVSSLIDGWTFRAMFAGGAECAS